MSKSRRYHVLYFASLRDRSGLSEELRESAATTPAELYDEVRAAYGFEVERRHLRVAVDAVFADWDRALAGGETVVFIPPVAGG